MELSNQSTSKVTSKNKTKKCASRLHHLVNRATPNAFIAQENNAPDANKNERTYNHPTHCPTKPKSRSKTRCRFGLRSRRGRSPSRADSTPPRDRTQDIPGSCRLKNTSRRWVVSSHHLPIDEHKDPPHAQLPASSQSERVTLILVAPTRRTLFDHHKARAQPAPSANPYRFLHRKLGFTEEAFEE